ncbi:uncharacterized protein LOC143232696 isoform X2 [Tachypleus tridentatus]|uniref:uncharacterized protein LOC143232696 isoform X2 n=1 Tax=Tachypleus tridentatus TaxID=6853 RepID=UPI003FD191DE
MKRFYVGTNASIFFLLLTALITVGICENISEKVEKLFSECPSNFCDRIQCPSVTECPNGEIIENASLCECCPLCVSYIEKDEICGQGPTAAASLCKPGLSCNINTKRCDEQTEGGPCDAEEKHRQGLLEDKELKFADSLWLPKCDNKGNFKKKQCKGSKCLCFNEIGDRIFGVEEEALAENMTCECSREMWKKKENEGLEWMTYPHEHCDSMGNYDELQCNDEICYCADPITGDPVGEATHIAGFHLLSCCSEERLQEHEISNEVQQLDQLRGQHGQDVAFLETESIQSENINGNQQASKTKENTIIADNQVLANWKETQKMNQEPNEQKPHTSTKTGVQIPLLGIHKTNVDNSDDADKFGPNEKQKKDVVNWTLPSARDTSNNDYDTKFSGLQYSPEDLAEYILRTDDEKGVAMAIEELLTEGLMTREKAIFYLQEVKTELNHMREQYEQVHRMVEEKEIKRGQQEAAQELKPKLQRLPTQKDNRPETFVHEESVKAVPTKETKVRAVPTAVTKPKASPSNVYQPPTLRPKPYNAAIYEPVEQQPDVDMIMIMEKLRSAESFNEEYILKEIIYQLAKNMFEQSIFIGDPVAEESLTRFSNFLATQVATNRISREMEQTVLAIVSTALVDSLQEYSGLGYSDYRSPYTNSMANQQQEIKYNFKAAKPTERMKNRSQLAEANPNKTTIRSQEESNKNSDVR